MTVIITINDKTIAREFANDNRARPWIDTMAKQWARHPYFEIRKEIKRLNEKVANYRTSAPEKQRTRYAIANLEKQLATVTNPGKMTVEIIATTLQKPITENP